MSSVVRDRLQAAREAAKAGTYVPPAAPAQEDHVTAERPDPQAQARPQPKRRGRPATAAATAPQDMPPIDLPEPRANLLRELLPPPGPYQPVEPVVAQALGRFLTDRTIPEKARQRVAQIVMLTLANAREGLL